MDHLTRFAEAAWERVRSGYYSGGKRTRKVLSLFQRIGEVSGNAIIAEIKPISPTAGDLLGGRRIAELAAAYVAAGAAGISVLTDPDHFGGSLDSLAALSGLEVPLLAKDFVVHPVQLASFYHAGADCVLLIMTLFERGYPSADLGQMIARAHELGLEVLLEVSSEGELRLALDTEADLIGVNSRDLPTLKVSLSRAEEILRGLGPAPSRPILALSGISSKEEIHSLKRAGFTGFLIGTSLLRAHDPEGKLRELILA